MDKFKVKTTDRQTIKVYGELVEQSKTPKPPLWFQAFEKRNNKRLDKLEEFTNEQKEFNKQFIKRFDNLVVKNKLKE